jgi:hypothetical protein
LYKVEIHPAARFGGDVSLRIVFFINAFATLLAGLVLFIAPELIPGSIGIDLDRRAYFLCYLLGASELGFATLSLFATRITDASALRAVVYASIVFHAASAVADLIAITQGVDPRVIWNVALRLVMIALFVRYGLMTSHPAANARG